MLSNLTQEAWDKKVIDLGGSILQSWAWGQFNQALGHKIYRFSDDNFANLGIVTDFPFGKKYLYCPRGPLGDTSSALKDLKKLEEDRELVFARIEPHHEASLPRAVKDHQPLHNWVLGLEKTEEELLIGMKPKTRYNINLAQRKGVTVRVGEQKDLLTVWQLFLETATRTKIRLHPQNYYFAMWEHLGPHVKILIAEYNGKPLAGMLLTLFGDTATYLHGGTSLQMREAMAPFLLHWEAIKIAKNLGYKNYDFGGIAETGAPDHPWAGITRFKKGFGGFEVVYPGAFDLVYSPIWYNIYKQGRKLTKIIPR
jgi:peptidoglycan pentaglycine glycine transferase (the first glycine)